MPSAGRPYRRGFRPAAAGTFCPSRNRTGSVGPLRWIRRTRVPGTGMGQLRWRPYRGPVHAGQWVDGPEPWTVRPLPLRPAAPTIAGMVTHAVTGRSALVVTASEVRRRDWSDVVRDDRTTVETCGGPSEHCVLLRGLESCPLVARSDVVLYDIDATTPAFLAMLLRAHRGSEVVLVRDRVVRGQHRPSVVMRRRPRGTAVDPVL